MTQDRCKICQKIVRNAWYAWVIHIMVHVKCIKRLKVAKICQFMLQVCLNKCKESSDLNFGGKLKAIHSAYLIINIVWYFQKKCDIDILTIFWKWHDNCITIFWGLFITTPLWKLRTAEQQDYFHWTQATKRTGAYTCCQEPLATSCWGLV